jgi:hypothetical protein
MFDLKRVKQVGIGLLVDLINYDRNLLRWLGSDTNEVDAISVALPVRQVVAQVGTVNAHTLPVW